MTATISVLAAPSVPAVETKSLLGKGQEAVLTDIDIETLKKNLAKLSQNIGELFTGQEKNNDFKLKQIEVGIEISAEGGVNLIGTLTAGAKTAIKLTFERS
jgi:hypothetical protein